MSLIVMFTAAVIRTADPSSASAGRVPYTFHPDHPVGVEASHLARAIEGGGLEVPRTYDGELLITGNVLSVTHDAGEEVAVITTGNSPDHLTAHVASNPYLKAGLFVGIACKKADGTEQTAIVSGCKLVSAPGMPTAAITFTPAN